MRDPSSVLGVPKMGGTPNILIISNHTIRMDDLEVPGFLGNLRIISMECTAEMAYSARL